MERITITLDEPLLEELDRLILARGYPNRSHAMREVARAGIDQAILETNSAPMCVATLMYVYDTGVRELTQRLTTHFHAHHDLAVATMRVALGHTTGLEIAILKGPTEAVRQLAGTVLAERGVAHGRVVMVPADADDGEHRHTAPHAQTHTHFRAR